MTIDPDTSPTDLTTLTKVPAEHRQVYLDALAESRTRAAERGRPLDDEMPLADLHRAIYHGSIKPLLAEIERLRANVSHGRLTCDISQDLRELEDSGDLGSDGDVLLEAASQLDELITSLAKAETARDEALSKLATYDQMTAIVVDDWQRECTRLKAELAAACELVADYQRVNSEVIDQRDKLAEAFTQRQGALPPQHLAAACHPDAFAPGMTADQLAEYSAAAEKAHVLIGELAAGERRWKMTIPANPDTDSDLILSTGLSAIPPLVAEVQRLTGAVSSLAYANQIWAGYAEPRDTAIRRIVRTLWHGGFIDGNPGFIDGNPGPSDRGGTSPAYAEVAKLKAALIVAVRSNVMCKHRLATTPEELAEHLAQCTPARAAIVAHEGSADEAVDDLIAAGWTLTDGVEFVAGKRIRTLRPPDGAKTPPQAVVDEHVESIGVADHGR